jgi:NAD(P)-dependent dehydrogenase (short-subunit alcohol dehydrogenase family)
VRIDLSGRTAVVTGSTAGIGFASAVGLAGAGARVVLNGRSADGVEDAIERLRAAVPGADAVGVAADLEGAGGAARVVSAAGEVDILVNNLGVYAPVPFEEISDEEWERFFQINVMSGVRLARGLLAGMAARGWGRVVFVSSESALHIPPEMIHYGVTKTAQIAVARGLAEHVAGSGVTVNAVLPGPTRTESVLRSVQELSRDHEDLAELEERFLAEHRPTSLIGRLATPEEVASLIVYVCSPQASATTGAALRVDGGVVRAIP